MSTPDTAAPERRAEVIRILRSLSATMAAGMVTGAVVGGGGGRIAMRVIFLTSPSGVKGLESDDGFEIGRFTLASTAGLIMLCALLGAFASLFYFATRPWLPEARGRRVTLGMLVGGTTCAALLVHTGGVDFEVLEPVALAVALLVAIGAVYPVMFIPLAERWIASPWFRQGRMALVLAPLAPLVIAPPLFVVVAIGMVIRLTLGRTEPMRRLSVMPTPRQAILLGAAAVAALSLWDLARDLAALT